MICPNCGTDNRSDARFCRKCGALLNVPALVGGAAPAAVAAGPPVAEATPVTPDAAPLVEEALPVDPAAPSTPDEAALPAPPVAEADASALEPQASVEGDAADPTQVAPGAAEDDAAAPLAGAALPPFFPPELAMAPPYIHSPGTHLNGGTEEALPSAEPVLTDEDHPTGPLPALDTPLRSADAADAVPPAAVSSPAPAASAPEPAMPPSLPAAGDPAQAHSPSRATQPLADADMPTAAPPAPDDPFPPLAPGVIVGNRYEVRQVLQTGPQHQTYLVTDQAGYVRCWACGSTDNMPGETYCNDCGAQLTGRHYRLYETPPDAPAPHLPEALIQNRVPGVAQVIDSLQDEKTGRHYLVLEEMAGQPLSALAGTKPVDSLGPTPLPLERVLHWLVQAADLLGDLHKGGAISCDFSPESLVVLPDDRLMLMDPASCSPAGKPSTSSADEVQTDVQRVAASLEQWYHTLPGVSPSGGEDAPTATLSTPGPAAAKAPAGAGGASLQTIDAVLARGRAGGYATAPELASALRELLDAEVPPRDLQLTSGRASDVGMQRQLNEDSVLVMEVVGMEAEGNLPAGVYIVADGMGGHQSGEVASSIAIRTVGGMAQLQVLGPLVAGEEHAPPPDRAATFLREAIMEANRRIAQLGQERHSDMGTTVTMALILGNQVTVANVGDSRTYLWRDGKLHQISQDHSLVARLIAAGQLTPEEGRHFDRRNEVYRALGDPHLTPDEIDIFQRRLRPFDALVLCSDGLWEMVRDEEIEGIMLSAPDLNSAAQSLVAAANKAGGEDNISVVIVQAVTSQEE